MYKYPWLQIDERAFVGDVKVKQGRQTTIGFGACLTGRIEMGEGVLIGAYVIITSFGHGITKGKYIKDQDTKDKTVFIGSDVWIGSGAIILPGNKIGDHAVIGAGSVLTEDNIVGENEVWVGNPCRFLKMREEEKI